MCFNPSTGASVTSRFAPRRDLVQSGSYVARLKRRKLDVTRADLLAYAVGGEAPSTAYLSSLGSEGGALFSLPFLDQ